MGASRLKREECHRTKHDSVFAPWKILIGPSDWEDHSLGKEGAERYRIHNLPLTCSCPGLYELGVVASQTSLGRKVGKLDSNHIVVVYLGQADNVRTRLQCYGRQGAHLDGGYSNGQLDDRKNICSQRGPGLFKDIFSKGFPIVFRWAPMQSKSVAEKTESQLLETFDYAWNKGSNRARRPDDILRILDEKATRFSRITQKLQTWKQKRVGIEIKSSTPHLSESETNTIREINDLLSRIFKFGTSPPRPDKPFICGVILDKHVCQRTPVRGRKRCSEHKGMKIIGSFRKFVSDEKSLPSDDVLEMNDKFSASCGVNNSFECGVSLKNGSICRRVPVHGRKRCETHKGMRIATS